MIQLIAFSKKEFIESVKTFKLLILGIVFVSFAIVSPVSAYFLPEILASIDENLANAFASPTVYSSYEQFFKNFSQMGMLVLLLVYGGMLSNELSKSSLTLMLTKGLRRRNVILSKFIIASLTWIAFYTISFLITYGYTFYLFGSADYTNLLEAAIGLPVFGVFVLALILLSSVIFKNNYGGFILPAALVALLMFLNIFPDFYRFNPLSISDGINILQGNINNEVFITTLIITVFLTIGTLVSSILVFNKRSL